MWTTEDQPRTDVLLENIEDADNGITVFRTADGQLRLVNDCGSIALTYAQLRAAADAFLRDDWRRSGGRR